MGIPAVQGYTLTTERSASSRSSAVPDGAEARPTGDPETLLLVAGIRLVCALAGLVAVWRLPVGPDTDLLMAAWLAYGAWATACWWSAQTAGARLGASRLQGSLDALWLVLLLHTTPDLAPMVLAMLVLPFSTTAGLHGTRAALWLGAGTSLLLLVLPPSTELARTLPARELALRVALIAVGSALAMHTAASRRQRRIQLLQQTEAIDPRHGLATTAGQMVRLLRQSGTATVAALTLPASSGTTVWFSTDAEGDFSASATTHRAIEQLLADLPHQVLSGEAGEATDKRHRTNDPSQDRLAELGRMLQVRHIALVPLLRDGHRRGHLVLGWHKARHGHGLATALELAETAPTLTRLLDAAELVDQLQDEAAGHERARIGRDLHDSAIQPYLGLKFAVESVARRAEPDSPLRQDLDALVELVNAEILGLRELVSTLRTGHAQGDNALVPAVRRLVLRCSRLFGIDMQLDCPASVHTSRAVAGATFQLVNEALNNVRKHTCARRVWIRIAQEPQRLHLHIRDNAGTLQGHRQPDFVPSALAERVADLGGTLEIGLAGEFDTELHLVVPDRA